MTTTFVVRHHKLLFALVLLCCLSGCSLYGFQAMTVRDALMHDQIEFAYSLVDKQSGFSDPVLTNMNKGILLRMKNDFVSSNLSLDKAKRHINKLYGTSLREQLGSIVINDSVRAYEGSRIEQLLLHAYMAMNYIELDDIDAARVEMLQAGVKMREWGDQPDDDPFIKYLSGMIYEALGENDQAIVSYRHAMEAYKTNRDKQGLDVPTLLIVDLMRLLESEGLDDEVDILKGEYPQFSAGNRKKIRSRGELIVILSNGLSPIKSENSITTFANEIEKTVRIALPVYATAPNQLNSARIVIDGNSDMLETVENVDGLARNTLEEEMPMILTRAIARAIVKHKSQHQSKGGQSMGGLLITMTNLITERADTRSWSTLPQEIQMSRHQLPPGKYPLDIEMVNNVGLVVDTMKQEVEIMPGKVTFVFKHWVTPKTKQEPEPVKPLLDIDGKSVDVSHWEQSDKVAAYA